MHDQYKFDQSSVKHYTCFQTREKISIDGNLTEISWEQSEKSPRFVDLVDGKPGFYDTRAALLWNQEYLYVAYWIEEPFVAAELKERDSLIFTENDVEFFIAGEDCYYEFEINALGTIYEAFFIWYDVYSKKNFDKYKEFQLNQRNVDLLGGFQDYRYGKHPRGKRWAFRDWDFPGLKSAVQIQGTLNNHSDVDKGWSVELGFPWIGMKHLAGNRSLPPKDGDIWRMDFSRFQKLFVNGVELEPHPGWAWNQHGYYDSHIPECFTYIHFTEKYIDTKQR